MHRRLVAPLAFLLFSAAACSPGDAVGQVDAMKPSTLDVDLAAGETLRFRVDDEVELISPEHQRMPRRTVIEFLQKSELVVTVKDPKGSNSVRCPLSGNGTTEGMSGPRLFQKGIVVSCAYPVAQAGKHQISATVVWRPEVKPLSATVEVRREKK
jgi:hypothetical protein